MCKLIKSEPSEDSEANDMKKAFIKVKIKSMRAHEAHVKEYATLLMTERREQIKNDTTDKKIQRQ